jgi:branched-chain amino acid transport system permease protein
VILDHAVGGLTGTSLIAIDAYNPTDRRNYTYWLALCAAVVLLGLVYWLLRSRTGASLQAIRDDEEAASSVGVRVLRGKGAIFVLAAVGCAFAGTLNLATSITYQPADFFSVQWTAYMLFMVLVGGLGTFEGPIIGAIVFFVVQDQLGDYGVWYLVGLGASAIVFALLIPRGIWGTIEDRFGIRLLPVGYRLLGVGGTRAPQAT